MRPVKKQAINHIEELTEQAKREWLHVPLDNVLLGVYLHRLGALMHRDFDKYCQVELKLQSSDVRVLLALGRTGPPYIRRPTDLFRALLVSSGALTKQVDRLVAKKLVTRFPNPSYGGGFLIQLTESGRKLVSEVVKGLANGSAFATAMWTLPAQDRKAAARFCYNAISLLENSAPAKGRPVNKSRHKTKRRSKRTKG